MARDNAHRTGLLRTLRGDGTAVRALILALFLQVLAPLIGLTGAIQAAPADSITVCTAHGIVTMVPDGQGGWVQASEPDQAGISCAFCLPLLSGHAGPGADLVMPMPAALAAEAPALVALAPTDAHPPGSFSPRAPPTLR